MEFFPNYNTNVDVDPVLWAQAREAEGWDGIVASDHYWIGDKPFPHLWVTLTQMACATERITLASSFANNLFRSPVEFAQASLALHRASGGRYEAGLGAGWNEEEMLRTGQTYPPGPVRVSMYREAMTIVRVLLTTGTCTFKGEYYNVDVPRLEPFDPNSRPLLVGACGGPRSIREITPLLDRVEIKGTGAATRGGILDFEKLATITHDDVKRLIEKVRAVDADIPIGYFAVIGVGDDPMVEQMRAGLGNGDYARFFGAADDVAEALLSLGDYGISRIQLTDLASGAIEALAPVLKG
ncbi:MAG: LLM class flavin-dependent oxidoreductase [Proteobacteria bacterium]|nr:LLM class flavin-dependent oxidoreductase [Pseudomonadota bacterium]